MPPRDSWADSPCPRDPRGCFLLAEHEGLLLAALVVVAYLVAIPANEIVVPTVFMLTLTLGAGTGDAGVMVELGNAEAQRVLVREHPRIDGYQLYESANFTRLTARGDLEASPSLAALVGKALALDLKRQVGEDHDPETHLLPLVLKAAAEGPMADAYAALAHGNRMEPISFESGHDERQAETNMQYSDNGA